ncbi:hypothetical protein EJ05DRAFT_359934 [Pseudovirgaria hyperparasitica]|uniref:Uncharacterized protein n=1 Tax=Pseudovirgaria hyperparasitica TaxID=470096 RepID=A0A6A6W7M2_9PEZI|nr:uncharacterized protein EJ05DRAFT_359934 [Pseudovirgaria hyperparasitica]KAF2758633.1 hypothetical protein EJ05DRAFT_359934 [Pseudovirgaria hyperparasitica]
MCVCVCVGIQSLKQHDCHYTILATSMPPTQRHTSYTQASTCTSQASSCASQASSCASQASSCASQASTCTSQASSCTSHTGSGNHKRKIQNSHDTQNFEREKRSIRFLATPERLHSLPGQGKLGLPSDQTIRYHTRTKETRSALRPINTIPYSTQAKPLFPSH